MEFIISDWLIMVTISAVAVISAIFIGLGNMYHRHMMKLVDIELNKGYCIRLQEEINKLTKRVEGLEAK